MSALFLYTGRPRAPSLPTQKDFVVRGVLSRVAVARSDSSHALLRASDTSKPMVQTCVLKEFEGQQILGSMTVTSGKRSELPLLRLQRGVLSWVNRSHSQQ